MAQAAAAGVAGGAGSRRAAPRRWVLAAAAVVVLAALAALGTTVVPDSEVAGTDSAGNPTFDAKSFVQSIWGAKVLPLLHDNAADIGAVLAAVAKDADAAGKQFGHRPAAGDGPWNFLVRGEAPVKSADLQSRHATVVVTIAGQDVTLQIGPVIFGAALRDVLPFLSFDQFENQIQFAQVSRELNDHASAAARAGLDASKLAAGARVAFAGAMAGRQVTVTSLRVTGP